VTVEAIFVGSISGKCPRAALSGKRRKHCQKKSPQKKDERTSETKISGHGSFPFDLICQGSLTKNPEWMLSKEPNKISAGGFEGFM
jgi:hypothetical protein